MKKRNSKKGFTLVELVIVIAVIAILASVLIPTFGNIITKANESAARQNAVNIYREVYALDLADGKLDGNITDTGYTKPEGAVWENNAWKVTVTQGSSTAVYNGTTCTVTTN